MIFSPWLRTTIRSQSPMTSACHARSGLGQASGAEPEDNFAPVSGLLGVEPGRRLVQQDEPAARGEGESDLESALRPIGERARRTVRDGPAHQPQGLSTVRLISASRARNARRVRQRRGESVARTTGTLPCGHCPRRSSRETRDLKGPHDAQARHLSRCAPRDRPAARIDAARRGQEHAGDDAEERGLPAPLGPISPRMVPGSTRKLTSLSATGPPNRWVIGCVAEARRPRGDAPDRGGAYCLRQPPVRGGLGVSDGQPREPPATGSPAPEADETLSGERRS